MGCIEPVSRRQPSIIKRMSTKSFPLGKNKESIVSSKSIESDYTLLRKWKEELDCKYYFVSSRINSKEFCLKVIKREKGKEDPLYLGKLNEVRKLSHPHILKCVDIYMDDINFYVVSELPKGEDLFEAMSKYKNFCERTAGKIFYQMASIIFYYHNRALVHGFLKPEYFLLEFEHYRDEITKQGNNILDSEGEFWIVLTEFGELTNFKNSYYQEQKNLEQVARPYYSAPEVLKMHQLDEKADVFSLGVILYTMFTGNPPFNGKDIAELKSSIYSGIFSFSENEWSKVSEAAKDLISKMLEVNPLKRISSREVLSHDWVIFSKEEEKYSSKVVCASVTKNLTDFSVRDQLQQATLTYICNQISNSAQVKELKKVFKEFDKNGDGVLSYEEFKIGYTNLYGSGVQALEIDSIITQIDKDKSGKIEYEEFLTATINNSNIINDQNLRAAFVKFDRDGSGKLSLDELMCIVENDKDLISNLLKKADKNFDGEISFEEFKSLMGMLIGEKEKINYKPTTHMSNERVRQQHKSNPGLISESATLRQKNQVQMVK